MTQQFDKLPPHSVEAEMCLLASMMLDKEIAGQMVHSVNRDAFYLADHQIIFDTLTRLHKQNRPIDAVIVREDLRNRGLYEEIGGDAYIGEILNKVPSAAHGAHYASIVTAKAKWRAMITIANQALRTAYGPTNADEDADTALMRLSADAARVAAEGSDAKVHHISDVIPQILKMRHEPNDRVKSTGLRSLDDMFGGLTFGMKHLVCALPSIGKSALLKTFALNLAANGVPVGIISVEENSGKIIANMLSRETGIDGWIIEQGRASPSQWDYIEEVARSLSEVPIHIVDSAYTISAIVAKAHLLRAKYDCRAIIVDHDHLIDGERSKNMTREQEISGISQRLKQCWKELDVIGIEACQLNRLCGTDAPTLASIRDSGTLAQDADVVMMLHREDFHKSKDENHVKTHILQVGFEKVRSGRRGTIDLRYDESCYQITDFDPTAGAFE